MFKIIFAVAFCVVIDVIAYWIAYAINPDYAGMVGFIAVLMSPLIILSFLSGEQYEIPDQDDDDEEETIYL